MAAFRKIIPLSALLALLLFAGCRKKEYSESHDKQITDIEKYLTDNNYPYRIIDGAYVTTLDPQPTGTTTLAPGDSLYFYFAEYVFTTQVSTLIDTNAEEVASEAGFEKTPDQLKAWGIRYGDTPLTGGLNNGLQECRENEHRLILLPFNKAYGEKWNGTVAPYTAIAFEIITERIVKNQ